MSDEKGFFVMWGISFTVACVIVVFMNAYESGVLLWAIVVGVLVVAGSLWKWNRWRRALVYGGIAAFGFPALIAAAMLWPILVFGILALGIVMLLDQQLRDLVLDSIL